MSRSWRARSELGIVPANTELAPKPDMMPDWDNLSPDEKKVALPYQEVIAAFDELTDHEIGRVVQAVDDIGALDNTLIVYITGDNGASPNGGRLGRYNTFVSTTGCRDPPLPARAPRGFRGAGVRDDPTSRWTVADNTPFAYSQVHTQYGGTTTAPWSAGPRSSRRG